MALLTFCTSTIGINLLVAILGTHIKFRPFYPRQIRNLVKLKWPQKFLNQLTSGGRSGSLW